LIGCKVTVTGRENIDKNKSYVFVMNHTSNLDSPNSTMVFMKITWVMKESLGKIPVFGAALRTCGSVFVNRSDPASARQAVINSSERIKRDGLSVVFFPEGTRTLDGKLQPFKKGAFKMAEDLDLDVVPVVIKGAYEVLTPGKFNLYPGEIKIHIHKPLEVSLGADKLLEESYRIIESDLNG
jgi:1-acyl-sn-glycerol-3-phosphate acyltransferase